MMYQVTRFGLGIMVQLQTKLIDIIVMNTTPRVQNRKVIWHGEVTLACT